MGHYLRHYVAYVWCFTLPGAGIAQTYYVAETGDNGNPGTSSSPWETLQYAANEVKAGDTVIVRPGEYQGFFLSEDGTPSAPIVFIAEEGTTITSANEVTADGINLEGADHIIIRGFQISNDGSIDRAGIRSVANTGVIIRDNYIDGMGTWGIFTGFSENILIENNTCTNSIDEHGIYHSNSADQPVIRGNICHGNHGCGIHMNGDISMGGDGIISGALVEKNIIYNNGTGGGSGINCDGVQQSIFRNNLLYGNHAGGISLYRIDAGGPASGNLIVNNTVFMAGDGRWCINIQNSSTGNRVYNNILFTEHSYRGDISISETSMNGFESDYNVLIGRFTRDDGNSVDDLETWQTETGNDMHSFHASPAAVFVSYESDDYHLRSGGDAVDKGVNDPAAPDDLDKVSRPQGSAVDPGAYEFYEGPLQSSHLQTEAIRVEVFPNPAAGSVTIVAEKPPELCFLVDGSGRLIQEITVHGNSRIVVDRPAGLSGMFYLQVIFDGRALTLPVVFR